MEAAGRAVMWFLLLVGPRVATGEIVLFWSTTGINIPDYALSQTQMNFLPYFEPPTPVSELPIGAHTLFLWFIRDFRDGIEGKASSYLESVEHSQDRVVAPCPLSHPGNPG